jgi:hypothetical protein
VVSPLFFPGGDIGDLAVNGTVNDLAVAGAQPLYLSAGFILEEGLPAAQPQLSEAGVVNTRSFKILQAHVLAAIGPPRASDVNVRMRLVAHLLLGHADHDVLVDVGQDDVDFRSGSVRKFRERTHARPLEGLLCRRFLRLAGPIPNVAICLAHHPRPMPLPRNNMDAVGLSNRKLASRAK